MFQENRICPSYFKKKHLSAPSNSKGHPHMRPSKRNNYLIQVLLKDNPICYRPFRVHPNLLKTLQSTPQSAPSPSKGHPNCFRSFKRTPQLLQVLQKDTPTAPGPSNGHPHLLQVLQQDTPMLQALKKDTPILQAYRTNKKQMHEHEDQQ